MRRAAPIQHSHAKGGLQAGGAFLPVYLIGWVRAVESHGRCFRESCTKNRFASSGVKSSDTGHRDCWSWLRSEGPMRP
jgi:hypothetical protein